MKGYNNYYELNKLFELINDIDLNNKTLINDKLYFELINNDLKGSRMNDNIISFIDYILINNIDILNLNQIIILMNLNINELNNEIQLIKKIMDIN